MRTLVHADEDAVGERSAKQPAWLTIGLGAASLLGAIIGLAAAPRASPAIAAMTLTQLAITAAGPRAHRRPVIWSSAVAVACLGSALTHPVLSELAYSGGIPWIGLATAAAALNLYRNARDRTAIVAGSAALVLGSAGLIAASIKAGIPAAPAIMATSLYFLLGVLAALSLQLRDARDDRVRRPPELTIEVDTPDEAGTSARAASETARRALAIVVLRSDELAATTEDVAARRTAADLRDVARRGLTGSHGTEHSVTRIEIVPSTVSAGTNAVRDRAATLMLDLPDREREVLRLVSTGASNAAIGRSLYLSEATVKQYVTKLMRKFDRENRTQLALMAAHWFDET